MEATYPKWHAKKVYMHLKFEVKTEIDREGRDRQSGDGAVVCEPPNEIHAQQTEDVLDDRTGFEVRVFDRRHSHRKEHDRFRIRKTAVVAG